jgi:hypothetical protein
MSFRSDCIWRSRLRLCAGQPCFRRSVGAFKEHVSPFGALDFFVSDEMGAGEVSLISVDDS